MEISAGTYNNERLRLAEAGSKRAEKAHPLHGKASVPDYYAQNLIDEAQLDEEKYKEDGKINEANRLRSAIRLAKNAFGLYSK